MFKSKSTFQKIEQNLELKGIEFNLFRIIYIGTHISKSLF